MLSGRFAVEDDLVGVGEADGAKIDALKVWTRYALVLVTSRASGEGATRTAL